MISATLPFASPSAAAAGASVLSQSERFARLRLCRTQGIGPVRFQALLAECGSAEAVLAHLSVAGHALCPVDVARGELLAGRKIGARLLVWGDALYPEGLFVLADAPPVLWGQGRLELLQRPMVAVVGARQASSLGLRMARRLSESLGEVGGVVVSGLARGIDAAAHAGALALGTVAVMAGGVDVAPLAETERLGDEIGRKGLRLSEHPPGMQPRSHHFVMRNRLISGLSRAVVVVEAGERSGSLTTARFALEQGREVMAVPGHPIDPRAAGCNALLREGALLVRGSEDIIEALGFELRSTVPRTEKIGQRDRVTSAASAARRVDEPAPPRALFAKIGALHNQILSRIGAAPIGEEQLMRDLSLSASDLAEELLNLELNGQIARHGGAVMAREKEASPKGKW